MLGHKHGHIYRHAGLKELVALHGEDQSGPLSKDEVSILRAVLDLRTKTVRDVMTHLSDVFMFSVSQKLDRVAIQKVDIFIVLMKGYERWAFPYSNLFRNR